MAQKTIWEASEKNTGFPLHKRSRDQVEQMLRQNPAAWEKFQQLTEKLQKELIHFSMGNRGLKISYDPFFKMIFDPEIHKERLSRLLSCIMGEKVTVKQALPTESNRITAEGSLLIMDILTELKNGELANIEIQKIGYAFPGERAACYSSDLMLRQYSRMKNKHKKQFTYRELKNVYTIVLIEHSSPDFHKIPDQYIHRSRQVFNTGLELNLLQKYIFVSLDVFLKIVYTLDTESEAWLLFLSSDKLEDIMKILEIYPAFRELYEEIAKFQTKPEELVNMYSDALEILDRNTVQYMIDEQQQEIEQQKKMLKEQALHLEKQTSELQEQAAEILRLQKLLEQSQHSE